ncbi:MAG: Mur ligase [Verrucomicrobiaceae bacterium]|nr:Mur ligase [Verrucomicrobiaceae bacterium]
MKIYFIGVCGTATGNVAILMKRLGHTVMGSDNGMYEPMKSALANAKVDAQEGWDSKRLDAFAPDLVVVGNAISRMNTELEFVLASRKYAYTSLPELIGSQLIGNRKSLVISGTHGKTTTSTLSAYLLRENGVDTGWLIGGIPANLPEGGSNLGALDAPFAIEGDEYDSAFFDKRSKFIHYRPHILVINNIEFDHADIFRDLYDVKRTFSHVRRIVNPLGAIVENGDDENIASLEATPWTQRISVGLGDNCDVKIKDFSQSGESSSFKLVHENTEKFIEWQMQGIFNARNAAMAIVGVALTLGRSPLDINVDCLKNFTGVKRRQEIIGKNKNITVVEDFGHHPTAIKLTVQSLRQKYPNAKIWACFEPRSNTAKTNVLQPQFEEALNTADAIYLGYVNASKVSPEKKFDTSAAQARNPQKFKCFVSNKQLLAELEQNISETEETVVVFFSNGSFDNIHKEFATKISAK